MNGYLAFVTVQLSVVIVITVSLGIYAVYRRRVPGSDAFILLMALATIWASCDLMEAWTDDVSAKITWTHIRAMVSFLTPLAWLMLALSYTHRNWWLQPVRLVGIALVPIIGALLALSNNIHQLVFTSSSLIVYYGISYVKHDSNALFFVFAFYAYGILIVSLYVFLSTLRHAPPQQRAQIRALILALLLPAMAAFRPVAGIPIYMLPSSLFFIPSGLLVIWAIFRYRMFDLVPVARSEVFQNLREAVILLDEKDTIMDVNRTARELLHALATISDQALIGSPISRFFHIPENDPQPEPFEIIVPRKRHTQIFEGRISPLSSDYHKQTGAILALRDITSRKQMEDALRQSEERYRDVVENQTELVCRYLPDATVTFVNDAYCRYYNISKEDIVGQPLWTLIPKEDREPARKHYESLLAEPRVDKYEHRHTLPDGSYQWQLWIDRVIIDKNGDPVEIQTVGRDITELKRTQKALNKSESYLRATIAAMPDLLFRFSVDGTYLDIHTRHPELLVASPEEILNHRIIDFLPEEIAQQFMENIRAVITTRTHTQFEYTLPVNNSVYTFEARMVPSGEQEVLTIVRDITERKIAQEQAFEMALETERARLLTRFIQSAAHEFRTPLATINTAAYLMSRSDDPERRKDQARRIEGQVMRTTRLVDMLLKYITLENNELPEHRLVDIGDLVRALANKVHISNKHIVEIDIPEHTLHVKGSSNYLQDAIEQILDNAQQYTPINGTISIRILEQDQQIIIEVEDSGRGISEENLARVFETFWRHDEARTTPGFGLGLSIARRAVELHGGQISVESTEGHGTVFRLQLPIEANNPAPTAERDI